MPEPFIDISRQARFIIEAIHPAPKPLSIFTTATFELQELSIANKAVSPPRLLP
jgi:hypothetical protein